VATNFGNRLLVIVPSARCAALNAFIRAGIDPTGADWLTPTLSATGSAPATHAWMCAAATEGQAKAFAQRVCQQASITFPADWDTKTRAERLAWVLSVRGQVYSTIGVYVAPMYNDGVWTDPQEALAATGLQVISTNP
jgi:hypothetical protein